MSQQKISHESTFMSIPTVNQILVCAEKQHFVNTKCSVSSVLHVLDEERYLSNL